MKKNVLILWVALAAVFAFAQTSMAQKVADLKFYDVKELIAEGKVVMIGQGEHHDSTYFYRIPYRLKGVVRKEVWELGCDGAGLALRFSTDSKCIGAKWTLTYNFGMSHMAYTGIKGMDMYVQTNSKKNNGWMYCGTAFPNGKNSASIFVRKMEGGKKEYMIYLPLYDGVEEMSIGIDSTASVFAPSGALVPEYKVDKNSRNDLPIVVYGTSVTQGGCATRPGMAYPSIISRITGIETVNLGFSGNGRMDANMADYIASIPARAYIIDCLANCRYDQTRDSSSYFISTIALAHPDAPVYMVNNYRYPQQFILPENNSDMEKENKLWKEIYRKLSKEGTVVNGKATGPLKNLRYIDVSGGDVIDNEDTVDGTHLTDLGFTHLAAAILRQMKLR